MARKKNAKALFEVISTESGKAEKQLGVPGWFGQAKPAQPTAPKAPAAPVSGPRAAPRPAEEPVLSVSGGRLRISLNQVSAVVTLAVMILLLVAAFLLGRRSAQGSPAQAGPGDPAGQGTTTGPASVGWRFLPVPGTEKASAGESPSGMVPDDAPRKKGDSYLVIQGQIQTYQEALDIKRFLYSKGVDATIHRMPHNRQWYMVKDMRGFRNLRSPQTRREISEYVAHIESLGREYQRQGGRFGFSQSREKGPWMITEK